MIPLEERSFKKINPNYKSLEGQPVLSSHFQTVIKETCILNLEGNKPIIYIKNRDTNFNSIIPLLQRMKIPKSNRKTLGNNNFSILTGGVPARTNRANFCNFGALVTKDNRLTKDICNRYSEVLHNLFKELFPQWAKIGESFLKKSKIHKDYIMANTIWTSSIINYNSEHNYHYDSLNLKNTYSALVALKNEVSGGFLVLPEYGIALETSNQSITFFYGKEILHGVSKINRFKKNAYRYSIVYYTVEELKKCQSNEIEFNKEI